MAIIYPPTVTTTTKDYPSYKLLDGGYVMGFASPASLRESTVGGLGAGTIWQGGAYSYTETATPGPAQVVTDGGVRLNINLNRYELRAEAFGVKFDGDEADASQNVALLQGALDWLEGEGQGGRIELASGGHMMIDHAIQCRNGITIDGRGTLTDNILNRNMVPGSKYTQDNCYLMGAFARFDDNDHSFHSLQGVERDSNEVVLTTPAMVGEYQVGDIIWIIEARDAFGSGGVFPLQSELARIVGIAGARLQLEHPLGIDVPQFGAGQIGSSPRGAWVANVDYRVSSDKGGGDMVGTRHVCRDVNLVNHRLRQSGQDGSQGNAPLSARSGMYNSHIENIEAEGPISNLVFGNGYAYSTWKNVRGPYIRRAIELKFLSHNSRFEDIRAWKMPHAFELDFDEHVPISIGEVSRRIELIRPRVDVGNWHNPEVVVGSNLIAFSGAEDSIISDPIVTGNATFSSAIAFPDGAVRCRVEGGTILPPSNVSIENSGIDNEVDGVRLGTPLLYSYRHNGTAMGGRMKDCTWAEEAPAKFLVASGSQDRTLQLIGNIGFSGIDNAAGRALLMRDNSNASSQALKQALGANEDLTGYATSATSETELGSPTVLPASMLQTGDVLVWGVAGRCTGSAGVRTLYWRAAIDTDDDGQALDAGDNRVMTYSQELPANCSDWALGITLLQKSASQMILTARLEDLTNGTALGAVTTHTSLPLAGHDLRIGVSGHVASGADSLQVTRISRALQRSGFLV